MQKRPPTLGGFEPFGDDPAALAAGLGTCNGSRPKACAAISSLSRSALRYVGCWD